MTQQGGEFLCEPVLIQAGWAHGFGTRGAQPPEPTAFPRQVHGISVVAAQAWPADGAPEADAIRTTAASPRVGIVTADCVPIFVASGPVAQPTSPRAAVAIHAGWRGFAAGVIEEGVADLASTLGPHSDPKQWVAAVGPAARGCCYEVDQPVRAALEERYADRLVSPFLAPGRPERFQLDLPALAVEVLVSLGIRRKNVGIKHQACTICHPERFESFRRDGAGAGRLRHFIGADGASSP